MSKIKVAVIFGGTSNEHDVSLQSASEVIQNLSKDKYEIISIGINKKGRWFYYPGDTAGIETGTWESSPDCTPAILSPDPIHKGFIKLETDDTSLQKVDVIFPLLHGKNGEDGVLQGLLQLSGIPYVGSSVGASASCMDKTIAHTILDNNDIQAAKWQSVTRSDLWHLDEKCEEIAVMLGFPLIVKPSNCGSTIGMNRVTTVEELSNAIKLSFTHDKKVIVEEEIVGREVECAVMGNDSPIASVLGEVAVTKTAESEFLGRSLKLSIPAKIDQTSAASMREISLKAFKAFGCSSLAKICYVLRADGTIIFNKINTLPGMTSCSMYPQLMAATGMPYSDLLDKLIDLAFDGADIAI